MGVKTNLYISTSWDLEEIKTIIEKYLKYSIEIETTHTPRYIIYNMTKKGKNVRNLSIFINTNTPIGSAILLSLGANDEGKEILKTIAKITGGIYQEEDSNDKFEFIDGMISPNNGLQYFLKYAVINNELIDNNDLKGLNKTIKKWQKKIGKHRIEVFE